MKLKIERIFKLGDLKTTIKKELFGGITSFLSCVYILSVNPNILKNAQSINDPNVHLGAGGVFLATVIAIFICTMLMGVFANVPYIVAPSMALNSMITINIANEGGLGYEGALISVMIASILFTIISISPVRKMVIKSMPEQLNLAVSIGIGFFIAYVGASNMGFFEKTLDTGNPIAKISKLKEYYPTILIGFFTLVMMFVFHVNKIKGGIIYAILLGLIPALILANIPSFSDSSIINDMDKLGAAKWKGWSYSGFNEFGINLSSTWKQISNVNIWNNPTMYFSIFIIIFLSFFDATGTITALNYKLSEETKLPINIPKKELIVDSFSTVVGSALGTSPMNAYIESSSGIVAGARSGLSNIFASICFIISIPLFPLFSMIPATLTGAVGVYVGTLMIGPLSKIDWKDYTISTTVFITLLIMLTTFSITDGLAMGVIIYNILEIAKGNIKKIKPTMQVLMLIFLGYFISLIFIQ